MTNKEFKLQTLLMIEAKKIVRAALDEDRALNDITGNATIGSESRAVGRFKAKSKATISGLPVVEMVFDELSADKKVEFNYLVQDGYKSKNGDYLAEVRGPERILLAGERSALNILNFFSGIATTAAVFVEAVAGTKAKIYHTRKTIPGLRHLSINAAIDGGAYAHRSSLEDYYLIKDNHVEAAGSVTGAMEDVARHNRLNLFTVVEVENMDQFREALALRPGCIMLDDMNPDQMREAVKLADGQTQIEVSGGVDLHNIRAIAETGVDRISIGTRLTMVPQFPADINFKTKRI